MRLYKKCRCCGDFFKAPLLSFEKYCSKPECQERQPLFLAHIKSNRSITLNTFDIYDLDRPLKRGGFERVCRICGDPLTKKDGAYNWSKRYCNKKECSGTDLFFRYNWGACSNKYRIKIKKSQKEEILEKIKEKGITTDKLELFILCEICRKLCNSHEVGYFYGISEELRFFLRKLEVINVHHIKPVYTLTIHEINLIFDESNLICLCKECHNKKHKSEKKEMLKIDPNEFKTMDQFF